MAKPNKVTPDELRRAFTIAHLTPVGSKSPDSDDSAQPFVFEALERQFGSEKADSLLPRVLLIMLLLATDTEESLVEGSASLLGVPEIHPAVFDVAATYPMPSMGVPSPGPFLKALEKRLRSYDILED